MRNTASCRRLQTVTPRDLGTSLQRHLQTFAYVRNIQPDLNRWLRDAHGLPR